MKNKFLKTVVFILSAFISTSCCNTETTMYNSGYNHPITSTKALQAERVNIRATRSYFYKFKYEGHTYLTNSQCEFVYHLPSCPCNKNNLNNFKFDYSNPIINE